MKEKQDVEKLLLEGKTVMIPLNGLSMYPFLIGGRDRVILSPLKEGEKLRRGDVLLYRRKGSILILHRLVKLKDGGLYFTGDNQVEIEGPLDREQVRGKMTGFERKGREHSVNFFPYRFCTGLWRLALPLRPLAWGFLRGVRKVFRKQGN